MIFISSQNTGIISKRKNAANLLILNGKSLMSIIKRRGSKTDPWGTPCFTIYHVEK
jgi:hypothetical protein